MCPSWFRGDKTQPDGLQQYKLGIPLPTREHLARVLDGVQAAVVSVVVELALAVEVDWVA
jgi:hypothetical protein